MDWSPLYDVIKIIVGLVALVIVGLIIALVLK